MARYNLQRSLLYSIAILRILTIFVVFHVWLIKKGLLGESPFICQSPMFYIAVVMEEKKLWSYKNNIFQ